MVKFSLKSLMIFVTLVAAVSGFSKLLFESEVAISAIFLAILTPIMFQAIESKRQVLTIFVYTLNIVCVVRLNFELWKVIDLWLQ